MLPPVPSDFLRAIKTFGFSVFDQISFLITISHSKIYICFDVFAELSITHGVVLLTKSCLIICACFRILSRSVLMRFDERRSRDFILVPRSLLPICPRILSGIVLVDSTVLNDCFTRG